MKKLSFIGLLVLIVMLASIGSAMASESRTVFQAQLGDEGATGSDAHGNAIFVFTDDGSQMDYKLVINGLDNTTQAHIHVADTPGANGPVVLWLFPAAPPSTLIEGTFNGLLGSGRATPADLTAASGVTTFEALRTAIAEGRAYVNAHTTAFPAGEIRGTIQ